MRRCGVGRGGSLGSGMRAGRRCLAPQVGGVRWAGSFPATTTRVLVALTGTCRAGRRCVFPQCGVGHASALGLVRSPVAISGLLRWSPSGAYHGCCMRGGYCAEWFLTMHTLRIARSLAYLRVPIDPARSPMPRNRLLPAPPRTPVCTCAAYMPCIAHKTCTCSQNLGSENPRAQFYYN